jgi:hypothetical protein
MRVTKFPPITVEICNVASPSERQRRLSPYCCHEEIAADRERNRTGVAEADGVPSVE